MPNERQMISPSMTYVAQCNNPDFNGYYFRKFRVPEFPEYVKIRTQVTIQQMQAINPTALEFLKGHYANNADFAAWYFLNILDPVACINGCMTFEDYQNIKDALYCRGC